ncbi:MAG: hypothetical protein N2C14_00295, partial [Planctomycetales bacterium]
MVRDYSELRPDYIRELFHAYYRTPQEWMDGADFDIETQQRFVADPQLILYLLLNPIRHEELTEYGKYCSSLYLEEFLNSAVTELTQDLFKCNPQAYFDTFHDLDSFPNDVVESVLACLSLNHSEKAKKPYLMEWIPIVMARLPSAKSDDELFENLVTLHHLDRQFVQDHKEQIGQYIQPEWQHCRSFFDMEG